MMKVRATVLVLVWCLALLAGCVATVDPNFQVRTNSEQIEPQAGQWKTWVLTSGDELRPAAPPDGAASPLIQLLPFAIIVAIFYFIILLPMKKRQKKVTAFLGALKVGDRIITSGGIYGAITKLNEQSVQLQIAQNVRIEVARSAIVGYQGQEPVVDTGNA